METQQFDPQKLRVDRQVALPRSRGEIGDWVWKVVNGGRVPRFSENAQQLFTLAQGLRAAGEGGDGKPIGDVQRAQAEQYAQLLGWQVTG